MSIIKLANLEGLEYLGAVDKNSIDLVFTEESFNVPGRLVRCPGN